MQTTLVFCARAGARLCQCPWKSTNLCSAMDAMEIHTIPVYPYRAGSRVCQPMHIHKSFQLPLSQSTLIGPGFANAHGYPHQSDWMPWKWMHYGSLPYPGFANAHAYPPSLSLSSVRAGARLCQCPWKSTNPCIAMDAMEIHTIPVYPYRARVCQRPCISTQSDSVPCGCHGNPHYPGQGLPVPMDIHHGCHGNPHWIQVYPYRARVCQCPCISTQSESMPWMQTTLVFCVRAGARLCQCPWKSTNLCSAMDAMEIHTIPVYPYRAGSRVCQHAYPQIFSAPIPVYPSMHIHPVGLNAMWMLEIHTIQGPMPTHIHPV